MKNLTLKVYELIGIISFYFSKIKSRADAAYSKKKFFKAACDVRLGGKVTVTGSSSMYIGNNVHIGAGGHMRAEGGLVIGDNTHISRDVIIYTINHNYEGARLPYDDTYLKRSVHIGKNVWIGVGVTIVPGARINDGAIIGAGAVVHGEIDKGSIMANSSLKKIGTRNIENYNHLESNQMYCGVNGRPIESNKMSDK